MARIGLDEIAVVGLSAAPILVGVLFGSGGASFYVAFVAAICLMVLILVRLRSRPVLLMGAVFLWLTIERFAIAAIAPALTTDTLPLLLASKELLFPALLLILLPGAKRAWRQAPRSLRALDALAVAFGALIVMSFLLSDAPLMDRVVNGRRLAVLPMVYIVARLLPWDRVSLRTMLTILVGGALLVAAFGLLERSILERPLWLGAVPAAFYYHLSSEAGLSAAGTDFPVRGLPVVFFDFTAGEPNRRLVSTFLEATTAASFLALGAIVAFARRPIEIRWLVVATTIAVATALTLSKAGWAILGLGMGYVLAITFIRRLREPAWLISLACGLLGALIVIALTLESTGLATGPLAHFDGLKEGIESAIAAPFGVGLGYGGNFGTGKIGAESTFGVTLVQLGWLGLLLWTGWILGAAVVTARLASGLKGLNFTALAAAGALAAFLATAALTESSGGLLGNWTYALVIGAILTVAGRAAMPDGEPVAGGSARPTETSRSRPAWEWGIVIGAPIAGNIALAITLAVTVPRIVVEGPLVPPVWSPAQIAQLPRLPHSDLTSVVDSVDGYTGRTYACTGPWATPDGFRNWACRTSETLAVLRGPSRDVIDRIDVTWFGFDVAMTDLPAWAMAAAGSEAAGTRAAAWVQSNVGLLASQSVPGLDLRTGGGRGAYTLSLDGQAPPLVATAP